MRRLLDRPGPRLVAFGPALRSAWGLGPEELVLGLVRLRPGLRKADMEADYLVEAGRLGKDDAILVLARVLQLFGLSDPRGLRGAGGRAPVQVWHEFSHARQKSGPRKQPLAGHVGGQGGP